jgi:hypothetical protein
MFAALTGRRPGRYRRSAVTLAGAFSLKAHDKRNLVRIRVADLYPAFPAKLE